MNDTTQYAETIERIIATKKALGKEIEKLIADWANGEYRNSPHRHTLCNDLISTISNEAFFYGTLDKIRRHVPPFN